jgi:hypothetical protein
MIDPSKIKQRLRKDYRYVETYFFDNPAEPIFFACNYNEDTFMLVSIYMDSEIGGHFTLDHSFQMEYVHKHFDAQQAWDLREGIIREVDKGNVTVIGDINKKELN